MVDLKRRDIQRDSWVPLCRYESTSNDIPYGHLGHEKEFLGAVAVMFPSEARDEALKCDWSSISPNMGHRPWVEEGEFFSTGTYISYRNDLGNGSYPVLQLSYDGLEMPEWMLDQDLVTGLGLRKEGDIWVCPEDAYIDVARLDRNAKGEPACLRIRTQYLRDFLCATACGLLVSTFQSRDEIAADDPGFGWSGEDVVNDDRNWRWLGITQAIHEGGFPYGETMAVFHSARTSVDPEEDVPTFPQIGEDSFESSSSKKRHTGKKLYRISGEMWRNHWVEPGASSVLLRDYEIDSDVEFLTDASGNKLAGKALHDHRGWIWFTPSVVMSMLSRRGGVLSWYTEETGRLGSSSVHAVHFGVNELGLINVLAKDIALMPALHQKMWAAHNVLPDGGISKELYMSQMRAEPASTKAPEELLPSALQHLRRVSDGLLGRCILKSHADEPTLLRQVHRFRGDSQAGLFALAKDLTKLAVEQLDQDALRAFVADNKGIASIKLLERFIVSLGFNGRKLTAPLVGVYELRQGDAHLSASDISESFSLLDLTDDGDYQAMAKSMIDQVACAIGITGDLIIKSKQGSQDAQPSPPPYSSPATGSESGEA